MIVPGLIVFIPGSIETKVNENVKITNHSGHLKVIITLCLDTFVFFFYFIVFIW